LNEAAHYPDFSFVWQEAGAFVHLRQPEIHAIDLSQITRADSACLSLLLTALRQKTQGSLKIHNPPASVRDLAQLYEIEEWITA